MVSRCGAVCLGLALCGCGAFNPAFLSTLDTSGSAQFATLDNAPGHVVIVVVNNAEVDERLLAFLESADGGNLVLTDSERRDLRARIRLRVQVTFTDGSIQTVEFIGGSPNLVDQSFDAQAFPDLNQNDLGNVVVLCDVAAVQILPGSQIEVFVPVELTAFDLVQTTDTGGQIVTDFQPRVRTPPQFRSLQLDQVDEDGNVLLQSNIGIRDVPSPAINPLCGSVVVITIDGVLSVPFLDGVSDRPSFDRADLATVARIGGRYEFRVSVQ